MQVLRWGRRGTDFYRSMFQGLRGTYLYWNDSPLFFWHSNVIEWPVLLFAKWGNPSFGFSLAQTRSRHCLWEAAPGGNKARAIRSREMFYRIIVSMISPWSAHSPGESEIWKQWSWHWTKSWRVAGLLEGKIIEFRIITYLCKQMSVYLK